MSSAGDEQSWAPGADTRRRLVAVAYRMLGVAQDAEDAVQDAFVRWERLGPDGRAPIHRPEAWFTTVVSRICLDQLGSARHRRETYPGVWLPEPVPGRFAAWPGPEAAPDPADVVTLEETVSLALLAVMESLTPAERVAFILHDVFGVPFGEIAETVGRTPQACRQLASSARRHLAAGRRYLVDGPERDRVVTAFVQACDRGDLAALVGVLDPGVVASSDGAGVRGSARRPVSGADRVARFVLGILRRARARVGTDVLLSVVPVNGQAGVQVSVGGQPIAVVALAVVALAVSGRVVARVDVVTAPNKLTRWGRSRPDDVRDR